MSNKYLAEGKTLRGPKSFLCVADKANFHSTYPVKNVKWLEETPTPLKESIEWKEEYWKGFDYALALLDEMYESKSTHEYNLSDCIKAKVNRINKRKIRVNKKFIPATPSKQAIEFAEWIEKNNYTKIVAGDISKWKYVNQYLTTAELYKLFSEGER